MNSSFYIGFDGKFSYIYIWISYANKVIYIGETNEKHGVIGRARQHVGSDGTLRKKVFCYGFRLEQLQDLTLLSFKLPLAKKYTCSESAYRLAVEYLVQTKCREVISEKFKETFLFVSSVTYTQQCELLEVENIADKIVAEFENVFCILSGQKY